MDARNRTSSRNWTSLSRPAGFRTGASTSACETTGRNPLIRPLRREIELEIGLPATSASRDASAGEQELWASGAKKERSAASHGLDGSRRATAKTPPEVRTSLEGAKIRVAEQSVRTCRRQACRRDLLQEQSACRDSEIAVTCARIVSQPRAGDAFLNGAFISPTQRSLLRNRVR